MKTNRKNTNVKKKTCYVVFATRAPLLKPTATVFALPWFALVCTKARNDADESDTWYATIISAR